MRIQAIINGNAIISIIAINRNNWFNPAWIPFLDYGGGDYLCLDTVGSFNGVCDQLVRYVHDDTWRSIEYRSIVSWLQITVAVVSEPQCFDADGRHSDSPEFLQMRRQLNPDYPRFFPETDKHK